MSTGTAGAAAIFAATLLLAGCIGGQDYATIRAEALQRGGGAEPFLVREAEAAVAARLSAEAGSVVIASIAIGPEDVTLVAADPRTPGNWDTHVYASGELRDARPVRVASGTLPAFRLGDFRALDRLPELVADARTRVGFPESELVNVKLVPAGAADGGGASAPRLQVSLTDPRRGTAQQVYDANGEPL
jgi:hypothetical protein